MMISRMMIKASGRAALIATAGLMACFVAPSSATTSQDVTSASSKSASVKGHNAHHRKIYAHRKFSRMTHKSSADKKADAEDVAADDGNNLTALPPSVANANAQLASADAPVDNDKAASALVIARADQTGAPTSADAQIVAADQLNDVDRALHAGPAMMTVASAETAAAPTPPAPVVTRSDDDSTWDKTSLIGKIFIAFGGLLTVASAARMFMA